MIDSQLNYEAAKIEKAAKTKCRKLFGEVDKDFVVNLLSLELAKARNNER